MTRAAVLSAALDQVLDGTPAQAGIDLDAAFQASADPWLLGLGAFVRFMALDYPGAVALGDRALRAAGPDVTADPDAVLLARVARGIASAGLRTVDPGQPDSWAATAPSLTPTGDPLADAAADLDALDPLDAPDHGSDTAHFVRYLVAEALLACGRLDLAAEVVARSGPVPALLVDNSGAAHPFTAMIRVMRARLLAFRGFVPEASAELQA
ncbi:MAG: hypothetical protein ABIP33_02980, partial [Pseudolysinimonas sp.]